MVWPPYTLIRIRGKAGKRKVRCRVSGSHSGRYEELYLLGYNAV
jgi:hypothetical protein